MPQTPHTPSRCPALSRLMLMLGVCLLCLCPQVRAQYETIEHDGLDRQYAIYVPSSYDGNGPPVPLVLGFHGGYGTGAGFQRNYAYDELAEAEGFIAVYPNGAENYRSWNAGQCCGRAEGLEIDDVGFVSALIDTLVGRYRIDTTRIYATGMSNGGMLTYRLACELGHRFAAVAPVACTMVLAGPCQARVPVPLLHIHSEPDSTMMPEGYYVRHWTGGDCGSEVKLMMTTDGGHSWPGSGGGLTDPASEQLDANTEMWAFFEQHRRDCEPTNRPADRTRQTRQPRLAPNPLTPDSRLWGLEQMETGHLRVEIVSVTGPSHGFVSLPPASAADGWSLRSVSSLGLPGGVYLLRVPQVQGMRVLRLMIR